MINKDEVSTVVKLARLDSTASEVKKYAVHLEKVLKLFEKIKKIKTDDVCETSQVTGLENVCEEDKFYWDENQRPKSQKELLAGVPESEDGLIIVPKVIEG